MALSNRYGKNKGRSVFAVDVYCVRLVKPLLSTTLIDIDIYNFYSSVKNLIKALAPLINLKTMAWIFVLGNAIYLKRSQRYIQINKQMQVQTRGIK